VTKGLVPNFFLAAALPGQVAAHLQMHGTICRLSHFPHAKSQLAGRGRPRLSERLETGKMHIVVVPDGTPRITTSASLCTNAAPSGLAARISAGTEN